MTHLSLHRCRFVDYPPAQITSLAFSHPSTPSCNSPPPKSLRLAIGRTNGSIEIWNPLSGSWLHETTLQGGKDRSIEGLAWVQDFSPAGDGDLRLFSIGYSSVITEWDLSTGRPRKHLDCNGGVIWSIAAQPRLHSSEGRAEENEEALSQKLVVGTDDGTLTLLSTAGGPGEISYMRKLVRTGTSKSRILSLAWQGRYTVVAGMADSKIQVWDVRSGNTISRMSLGRDKGRAVLVWAVKTLPNGNVVSGDSRGEVCFWDGKTWTLKQRLRSHEGDCLALEVGGKNGEIVFSAGVDMRTVVHRSIGDGRRWGEIGKKRFHKHDVRAMAGYECGIFSVVVSGGVDMTPIIIPLRNFQSELHLTLPAIPQMPIVSTIPESRLMMSWWGREVKVWKVEELGYDSARGEELYLFPGEEEERGRRLISRIVLNNEENLTSATLSLPLPNNGGHVLAISTIAQIKLFHLRPPKRSSTSEALRVAKITIPESLLLQNPSIDSESDDEVEGDEIALASQGARFLQFSPNGKWLLVVTPDSRVLMVSLKFSSNGAVSLSPRILELQRKVRPIAPLTKQLQHQNLPSKKNKRPMRADEGSHKGYDRTITRAAFSGNSQLLGVSDLSGWIDTFASSPSSKTWSSSSSASSIPRLSSAVAVMSFRPSLQKDEQEDRLLLLTAKEHHLLEFNVLTGNLSDWSRRNPSAERLPIDFRGLRDRGVGMAWEISAPIKENREGKERVWIWGASWIWMFNLGQDLPVPPPQGGESGLGKRKRGSLGGGGGGGIPSLPANLQQTSGAGGRMKRGHVTNRGLLEGALTTLAIGVKKPTATDDATMDEENEDHHAGNYSSLLRLKSAITDNEEDSDSESADETTTTNHNHNHSQNQNQNQNHHKQLSKQPRSKPTKKGAGATRTAGGQRAFWSTHRYKNLLAFLPIGSTSTEQMSMDHGENHDSAAAGRKVETVEMVVVERPAWDLEMPPRFFSV